MKIIFGLAGYLFLAYLFVKLTYKIGVGLGYWSPFVMVIVGLVSGLVCGIAKWVIQEKAKK